MSTSELEVTTQQYVCQEESLILFQMLLKSAVLHECQPLKKYRPPQRRPMLPQTGPRIITSRRGKERGWFTKQVHDSFLLVLLQIDTVHRQKQDP